MGIGLVTNPRSALYGMCFLPVHPDLGCCLWAHIQLSIPDTLLKAAGSCTHWHWHCRK